MSNIFNQVKNKNRESRDDINSRMNKFNINQNPQIMNFKEQNKILINQKYTNMNTNNSSNSSNSINNTNEKNVNYSDKKSFKNDINERVNSLTGAELFYRRLPLNNNIRDYNITVDSNKDEFNNRLMNYNKLATNINPNPIEEKNILEMGFHNNFKDDTNKRLEELSPLSCNIGFPINNPDKKPDFSQNLEPLGNTNYNKFSVIQNNNNIQENNNQINKLQDLQYQRHLPADTTQQFYFKHN